MISGSFDMNVLPITADEYSNLYTMSSCNININPTHPHAKKILNT